jgi:hypothetical protein
MRRVFPIVKFPHKTFAFLAVFAFIAFLLTLKPVAEATKSVVEKLGITFPPVEIFRNTAANLLLVALGTIGIIIAGFVTVVGIKVALIVAAVAVVAVGLVNVYRTFTGGTTINIMPEKNPLGPKG